MDIICAIETIVVVIETDREDIVHRIVIANLIVVGIVAGIVVEIVVECLVEAETCERIFLARATKKSDPGKDSGTSVRTIPTNKRKFKKKKEWRGREKERKNFLCFPSRLGRVCVCVCLPSFCLLNPTHLNGTL